MRGSEPNTRPGRAAAARAAACGGGAGGWLWPLLLTAAAFAALGCAGLRGGATTEPREVPMSTNRGASPVLTLSDANHPAVSADGRRVAVTPEIGVTEVYDVATGRKLQTLRVAGSFGHALSADGARLVVFADTPLPDSGRYTKSKREAFLYEVESGRELSRAGAELSLGGEFSASLSVYAGAAQGTENVSADLRFVAAPVLKGRQEPPAGTPGVVLGDLARLSVAGRFGESAEWEDDWGQVSLTPDARVVAATRHNIKNPARRTTVVWGAGDGRELMRLPFRSLWLALSADGRRLVTARDESPPGGAAALGVDERGRARGRAEGGGGESRSGGEPVVEVWEVASGRRLASVAAAQGGGRRPLRRGTLSPDGALLATASGGRVLLWNAASGRLLAAQTHARDPDSGLVKTVAFSQDGQFMVTGSFDEVVKIWRVADILKDEATRPRTIPLQGPRQSD
ncbi:MAG: hypothetical protein LC802_20825 [Acidobacteria bacterium]|nr:hypothetical protein [Acidobacteriota bacterium]